MKVRSLVARAILVALVLVGVMPLAMAQGVGEIGGRVQDASGAVIPGVTVVLSNPGVIGGNQQMVTDERGSYQFTRLVPSGSYSVKAELTGFRTAVRENVAVNADVSSRVDLSLEVGETSDTVTVTGDRPLLDTTSILSQNVIESQILEKLPSGRDVWTVARMVPAVVMNKYDVGGSDSLAAATARVHGARSTEGAYMVDGMDTTWGGGTSNTYYDPMMFSEVNYQTGNASAEQQRGGLVYNLITKTGTNDFHGAFSFTGTNDSMQSNNVTPELHQSLKAGLPAALILANPNLKTGTNVLGFWDGTTNVNGPIVRDKLWFSAEALMRSLNRFLVGSYNPDGTQLVDDNRLVNYSFKASWQVTPGSQLHYTYNYNNRETYHRTPGFLTTPTDFSENLATYQSYLWTTNEQLKWTATLSPRLVLDMGGSLMFHSSPSRPQKDVKLGDIPRFDSVTRTYSVAYGTPYGVGFKYLGVFNAGLSYVAGSHRLKFGYQHGYNRNRSFNWGNSHFPAGLTAIYRNGAPDSVRTFNSPTATSVRYQDHGVYIQDEWRATRKVTLNLGLRLQKTNGSVPAGCQVETIFIQGQCFPAVNNIPDWLDLSPRFGLVYDVFGNGRTAVKVGANRYYVAFDVAYPNRVNPIRSTNDTRPWTDSNGDLIPQLSELGLSRGFNLGTTNRYDADVKRPFVNELNVEVQHQLPGDIVVSVSFNHRETRRNVGSKNLLVPLESYTPLVVTERTSGRQVTVYNQDPLTLGKFDVVFDNFSELDDHFNGVDVAFSKRLSNRWMMMGGLAMGRNVVDTYDTADLNNPNNTFRRGVDTNDIPVSFKIQGIYELPYGISASANLQRFSGWAESDTVLVNANTVPLTQVSQSLRVTPLDGSSRLPSVRMVDFSLRKIFRIGEQISAEPVMEVFNLLNANTVLGRLKVLGPSYNVSTAVLGPRMLRLGLNMKF